MKKIKLLLAAVAAMFTLGAQAQSWTAPVAPTIEGSDPVSGGTYKIMNTGAGMFLDMGKAWFSWSTTAILSDTGINFTVNADGSNWKFIRTGNQGVFTSGNDIAGDAMHVDNTANSYGITKLANGYYHIHDAGGDASSTCWGWKAAFHAVGVVAHADATAEGWNCDWVFLIPAEAETKVDAYNAQLSLYNARVALYNNLTAAADAAIDYADESSVYEASTNVDALNAATTNLTRKLNKARFTELFAGATNENPIDVTAYCLVNPDFESGNISGWETNYVEGQQAKNIGYQGASYTNGDVTISKFIEAWRWSPAVGDGYLRQTVLGLPEGKYLLEADAIAADQPGGTMPTGAYLYINAGGVDFKTAMATGDGKPEHFSTEFLCTGDDDVVFGLKTESSTANWICADNFTVKYYGIDLSPYAALLAEVVAAAEAVDGTVPAAVYSTLAAVVSEQNQDYDTSAAYATAISAIQEATATAKALQSSYARYQTVKTAALAVSENVDVAAADAAVEAATTTEAVNAAVATLRDAFLAELPNVEIEEGSYIDVTAVLVDNASVRQNTNYWTIEGTQVGNDSFGKVGDEECEFYNQNFKFYQTLTLPLGTWEFGVTGFHRGGQGDYTTYFYAGEDRVLIPGVENTVVNSMAQAKTYFDNGNGKVALKFSLEEESNEVEIGIENTDTQTDKWTIFRDFTLKYYGAYVDLTMYKAAYDEAAAAAEAALEDEAYVNVTGDELTALTDALEADEGETKASILAATNAIVDATAAFTAAAPAYDAFAAQMAEAEAAWGAELFAAIVPATAAEATAAYATINQTIADYVAANYTYSLTGKIGEFDTWTVTAISNGETDSQQTLSTEHYSGVTHNYYEQGKNGWGSNTWSVVSTKLANNLPAGNYVLKVAARASADVEGTLSASATEVTVSLPNRGASTKGITTDGTASYDEGTFANNGNGYGWEWRFLPFTIDEAGNVTLTITLEGKLLHNWASLADAQLLSDADKNTKITLSENDDLTGVIAANEGETATVTIDRALVAGYNTVVLPFALGEAQVKALFGNNAVVYNFSENSTDANDVTVNFATGNGAIAANTPVLVKIDEVPAELAVDGVVIEAAEAVVEGTNVNFVGTYAPQLIEDGNWFLKDAKIYKSIGMSNIAALRAYIAPQAEVGEVKVFIDGIATRVAGLQTENAGAAIFNVAGQRVARAQKGLYIVSGKKVLK